LAVSKSGTHEHSKSSYLLVLAKIQRSGPAPDIVPVDFALDANSKAAEDDWDPSLSDLHVSLVSMDFGEDDEVDYYDGSVVNERRRTTEATIRELDEAECISQDVKKLDSSAESRQSYDLHPKLFMKNRAKGIIFLENEEKI
jgi:hypothetical protein